MKLTPEQRAENARIAAIHQDNKNIPPDAKPIIITATAGDLPNKIRRHRSAANFQFGSSVIDAEHPTGVSETVPNQALTVNELLYRHQRGLPIPTRTPIYHDLDLPDFNTMDLTERQEYMEANQERINEHRRTLEQAQQREKDEKARKTANKPPNESDETIKSDSTPPKE